VFCRGDGRVRTCFCAAVWMVKGHFFLSAFPLFGFIQNIRELPRLLIPKDLKLSSLAVLAKAIPSPMDSTLV
jgi:hypothetical protein